MLLVFAILFSFAVPVGAAGKGTGVSFKEVKANAALDKIGKITEEAENLTEYEDTDVVRVSILLEKEPTLMAGFSTVDIAANAAAMSYRKGLEKDQDKLLSRIENKLGSELDVAWNLTLAANLISANIAYGDIEKISQVPGVQSVVVENRYEPCVVKDSVSDEPAMITSTRMSGAVNVWANGYTGAGSRVAVIDTGIDIDHQSFSPKGLAYSLKQNAEAEGKTESEYLAELDLLDKEEIAAVADQLNIPNANADRLYNNSKVPFGYNYVDKNYKITHDYDDQGEHGSHVEGIAAANAYIPQRDGSFAEAMELVNVKGVAPDAQIITMKVFGASGGAYDSDYMVAIEDAIVLGCDSVNLSLGSGSSGFSFNKTYQDILTSLQETDTVVTISAGNSYGWDENTATKKLYVEDVRFSTNGSPGSYSNSLCVASVDSTSMNDDGTYTAPDYYTMSDFSSWGIPESLEMKPEITAPGGDIYSVNGAIAGGKSYESMSGTSMAAPQMLGMAGVMAEYIKENNLVEKTGLSVRQLSQSLLMSTAQPLFNQKVDYYYSVLKQGAGMARVDAATAAKSYILMNEDATAYAADGKVKVELGDDANRAGVYTFGFTLNNMSDQDTAYRLRTDLFTQATDGTYMLQTTSALAADVVYTVNGETYIPAAGVDCDLNGDGVTDAQDAQIILNYALGLVDEIDGIADLDGSGAVDTYDAHLLLAGLRTGIIEVKAGETIAVQVTASLTAEQKAALNEAYPNGTYVEGYTFAEADGDCDVTHSIPVLGFYGNWSDPSMFGISYTDSLYGVSRKPYVGAAQNNDLVVNRGGELQILTGNPYLVEDSYPAGKAAIRGNDLLDSYRLTLLRNASAMLLFITDADGKELYASEVNNQAYGAYYYVNGSAWRNTDASYAMGFSPASLGLEEGDRFTVTVLAVPEYYTLGKIWNKTEIMELYQSGILGKGATLSAELVVDNTAPTILSAEKNEETNTLTVTCTDNQYAAAMRLVSLDGTTVFATAAPSKDAVAGGQQEFVMDLTGVKAGETCLVLVGDYAGNERTYEVSLGLESGGGGGTTPGATGNLYGYSSKTGASWLQLDVAAGTFATAAAMEMDVTAAEYVDGYAYMIGSDGCLYVAAHGSWNNYVKLADLSDYGVWDLALHYADQQLYALGAGNKLYTVDLYNGALTEQFSLTIVNPKAGASEKCKELRGLGIDGEGNFYAVAYAGDNYEFASCLYTFTKEQAADGKINDLEPIKTSYGSVVSTGGYGDNGQTLAWDHENNKLYYYGWGRYDIDTIGKFNLDPGSYSYGNFTSAPSALKLSLSAMYFMGEELGIIETTTEAESLNVGATALKMMPGSTATIAASVSPWTLKDQSLVWESSDETVATVKNGTVYAQSAGAAQITVTTNAAPKLSRTIDVTVSELPEIDLYGFLQDEEGAAIWMKFNTSAPENWETAKLADGTAAYGAVNLGDVIYVHDGSVVYAMNPDTFELEEAFAIGSYFAWADAAEAPATADGYFDRIVAPCNDGAGVAVIDPYAQAVVEFDASKVCGSDLLVTMAFAGEDRKDITVDGAAYSNCPVYTYYSISESGAVYKLTLAAYLKDGAESYQFAMERASASALKLTDAADVGNDDFAGSVYDPASGCLVVMAYKNGDSTARVYAVEATGGATCEMGNVRMNVWPAYSLYQYEAPAELTLRVRTDFIALYVGDEEKISAAVSPLSFTGGIRFTSSDESVAVVDANGVVTGVGEGSAVITVATVDTDASGSSIVKEIPVAVTDVLDVDLTVNAKLDFNDLGSKWVSIDTKDLKNPTILADDHAYLSAGAVHDGMIAGGDGKYYIDWNYWTIVSNLYLVEPAYDYDITPGGLISYTQMPSDMSTMPAYEASYTDADGNAATVTVGGQPIYLDVSEDLIMWDTSVLGDLAEISGWKMQGQFDGTAGTLAFIGMRKAEDESGAERDAWVYAVITDSGNLYTITIVPNIELVDGVVEATYSASIQEAGNIGLTFDDPDAMSSIYVNDGKNTGLLIAYSGKVAELYYADLSGETIASGKIGSIPDTNLIGAMYFADEMDVSAKAPALTAEHSEALGVNADIELERSAEMPAKLTSDKAVLASGALNAVCGNAEAESQDNTVVLTLTEDVAVTNGIMEVTYDPAVLTYVGTTSAYFTAVKLEEGKITVAYASGVEIEAGSTLATLHFTYAESGKTTVSAKATQRNAENTVEEDATAIQVVLGKSLTVADGMTGEQLTILTEDEVAALDVTELASKLNCLTKTVDGVTYAFAGWFTEPQTAGDYADWTAKSVKNVTLAADDSTIYAWYINAGYLDTTIAYTSNASRAAKVFAISTAPADLFANYGFVLSTAPSASDENLVIGGKIDGLNVAKLEKTTIYSWISVAPFSAAAPKTANDFNGGLGGVYKDGTDGYISYGMVTNMPIGKTISARAYYTTLDGTIVYGSTVQQLLEANSNVSGLE